MIEVEHYIKITTKLYTETCITLILTLNLNHRPGFSIFLSCLSNNIANILVVRTSLDEHMVCLQLLGISWSVYFESQGIKILMLLAGILHWSTTSEFTCLEFHLSMTAVHQHKFLPQECNEHESKRPLSCITDDLVSKYYHFIFVLFIKSYLAFTTCLFYSGCLLHFVWPMVYMQAAVIEAYVLCVVFKALNNGLSASYVKNLRSMNKLVLALINTTRHGLEYTIYIAQ